MAARRNLPPLEVGGDPEGPTRSRRSRTTPRERLDRRQNPQQDVELSDRTNRPHRTSSREDLSRGQSFVDDGENQLRARRNSVGLEGDDKTSQGAGSYRHRRRQSHGSYDFSQEQSPMKGSPSPTLAHRRHVRSSGDDSFSAGDLVSRHADDHASVKGQGGGERGQVHFMGAIVGATGFPRKTTYASWGVILDEHVGWSHVAGVREAITQPSSPEEDEDELTVWEHPIDIHLQTSTLQQWPYIVLKVYHRSIYVQRDEFYGYACCPLPSNPGVHEFSCSVWRPNDDRSILSEEYHGLWTGLYPQCVNDSRKELVDRPGWEYSSVQTCGMGRVHFRMFVISKGMDKVRPSPTPVAFGPSGHRFAGQGLGHGADVPLTTGRESLPPQELESPGQQRLRQSRASRLSGMRSGSVGGSDEAGVTPGGRHSRQGSRDSISGSFRDSRAGPSESDGHDPASLPPRPRHRRTRSRDVADGSESQLPLGTERSERTPRLRERYSRRPETTTIDPL